MTADRIARTVKLSFMTQGSETSIRFEMTADEARALAADLSQMADSIDA